MLFSDSGTSFPASYKKTRKLLDHIQLQRKSFPLWQDDEGICIKFLVNIIILLTQDWKDTAASLYIYAPTTIMKILQRYKICTPTHTEVLLQHIRPHPHQLYSAHWLEVYLSLYLCCGMLKKKAHFLKSSNTWAVGYFF